MRDGVIAGAAIDVVEPEPIDPDDPLLSLENMIVTPHAAFYSADSLRELAAPNGGERRGRATRRAAAVGAQQPGAPEDRSPVRLTFRAPSARVGARTP